MSVTATSIGVAMISVHVEVTRGRYKSWAVL